MSSDKDASEDEFGVLVLTDAVDAPTRVDSGAKLGMWSKFKSRLQRSATTMENGGAAHVLTKIKGRGSEGNGNAVAPSLRKKKRISPSARVPYLDENKILRIGSQRLAVAIDWRIIQDDTSIRDAGKALSADGTSFDLFVRRRKTPQVAFASRASGLTQGDWVGATAFNNAPSEDWIAAFEVWRSGTTPNLSQAWWLVGYRDGLVYEDRLVFDEITARAALEDHAGAPGWERVIAPSIWQLPYAQSATLEEIIALKAASRLRSMNPIRAYAAPIVMTVLFFGVAGGVYIYRYNLQQEELILLEIEQRRLEEARLARLQTPPWVGTPTVNEFLSVCSEAIERNLVFSPGWNPGEFVCTLDNGRVGFSTSWNRAGGRAAWILAAARRQKVSMSLDASLQTAAVSEEVPFIPREVVDVEALPGELIERTLRLRFDSLSLDATLSPVEARPAPTSETEQGTPIWNYHELTFQTSGRLAEYLALFSDIPAIVPNRLNYNIQVHEWTLTLRIYHQPIGATP